MPSMATTTVRVDQYGQSNDKQKTKQEYNRLHRLGYLTFAFYRTHLKDLDEVL
jgi:hypothetical protein